jgi:heavy metal sensor kinase
MINSFRVKLTLLHLSILSLLLIVFSATVYTMLAKLLYERQDAVLRSIADAAASMLIKEAGEEGLLDRAPRDALKALSFSDVNFAIYNGKGVLVAQKPAGAGRYAPIPSGVKPLVQNYTADSTSGRGKEVLRIVALTVSVPNAEYTIVVSRTLEPVLSELASLRRLFYGAIPFALLMAGFGGWFVARRSLAPVVAMANQARRISAQNMDERLSVPNARDELGQLGATFNELLERLRDSFSRQRQFMADASHELRTPISIIKTGTSVILEREHREESEYRSLLATIDQQGRRLARIVEDLFRLAKADAGSYVLQKRGFYLDELVAEVADSARVLGSTREISIVVADLKEAPYYGDEDLVRQMILNLLDNSLKYTPAHGQIGLALDQRDRQYVITVSDNGKGIPADARPHIFERFFRVNNEVLHSPVSDVGGSGLGLPISRWIAEAHNGSLELEHSDCHGSIFVARLPASSKG